MQYNKTDETFKNGIKFCIDLQKKFPDLICGIDSFENIKIIKEIIMI